MNLMRALRVQRGDVVTLVGGGGKTTLMFALATDAARAGWRVVTTMTTHIYAGQTVHVARRAHPDRSRRTGGAVGVSARRARSRPGGGRRGE